MIPFLVVTSIVNLALGYALACYLGKASAARSSAPSAEEAMTFTIPSSHEGSKPFAWPVENTAPSLGQTSSSPTQTENNLSAGGLPVAFSVEERTIQTNASAVEKDLLAGIEEFRTQLAQLKSRAVPAEAPVA